MAFVLLLSKELLKGPFPESLVVKAFIVNWL